MQISRRRHTPRKGGLSILALMLVLVSGGCATLPERLALDEPDAACVSDFLSQDLRIEEAGVADGGAARVRNFPWLRVNRFLESFRHELDEESRQTAWLEHMRALDLEHRRSELANLQGVSPDDVQITGDLSRLDACGTALNQALLRRQDLFQRVQEAAVVRDDYRVSQRWLGAYPITGLFVLVGVTRLHAEQSEWLEAQPQAATGASWLQYTGAPGNNAKAPDVAALPRDALGIPRIDSASRQALFDRHAPIWRQETVGDYDRIGAPAWTDADRPVIDSSRQREFRFLSYARFDDQVVVQLNYKIWLPERPRGGLFDLLAGHMNGAIWRVTLAADGRVLAGESLHACGCYYMAFPGPDLHQVAGAARGEPVFAGPVLPVPEPGQRIRLTRESRTHYLVHVDLTDVENGSGHVVQMPVRPAASLRSLPHPDGRISLYRPDGLITGTQRPERWLLWPMGVPSAGAMRQPGRHAIAFVGRRHFDDPLLLARHFELAD